MLGLIVSCVIMKISLFELGGCLLRITYAVAAGFYTSYTDAMDYVNQLVLFVATFLKKMGKSNKNILLQTGRILPSMFLPLPIPSMYGIFTQTWLVFMVNVGKYIIHAYGLGNNARWNPWEANRLEFLKIAQKMYAFGNQVIQ